MPVKNQPPKVSDISLSTKKDAISRMKHIANSDQEMIILITLSPDYRIIGEHLVALGDFYSSECPMAVIFNRRLQDKANMFMIGHNHPNGVGIPSEADINMVYRLKLLGDILKIYMVDSIILPYGKNASSLYSKHPKIFNSSLLSKLDNWILPLIPKKYRGN